MQTKFKIGAKVNVDYPGFPKELVGVVLGHAQNDYGTLVVIEFTYPFDLKFNSDRTVPMSTLVFSEKFVNLYNGTKEVILNDEYTAEVSKGKVKVGCQEFPIEKIEEILKVEKSLS